MAIFYILWAIAVIASTVVIINQTVTPDVAAALFVVVGPGALVLAIALKGAQSRAAP